MKKTPDISVQLKRFPKAASRMLGLQRGFSIVSAIFLIVVLAVLGVALVSISTTENLTAAQDFQGSNAYHAARAGAEWGVYAVLDPTNATVVAPANPLWPNFVACFAPTNLTIGVFNVAVSCSSLPGVYNEAGTEKSIIVYQITSTATSGTVGTLNRIERQIRVKVSKCRSTVATTADRACG